MNKTLRALQQRKAQAVAAMRVLADAAAERDMTAEENTEFERLSAQVQGLNTQIQREEALLEAERDVGVVIPD
ncbi:phage major capsid protein, partial [Burkholderia sp. SIMBA_048]